MPRSTDANPSRRSRSQFRNCSNIRHGRQLSLLGSGFQKPKSDFGGSLLNGNNAKLKRTLDSKLPLLVTLRANSSGMRLPKVFGKIENLINQVAAKYGVRLYEHANVGNHIHLLIRCPKRQNWNAFIRELTGRIALLMKKKLLADGLRKALASANGCCDLYEPNSITGPRSTARTIATKEDKAKKFWMYRPHTRIIAGWKKAFEAVKEYVIFNQWEAEGHISRKDFAKPRDFKEFWARVPRME